MKRLPLAAALAAFFVLLVWSVSVRQAVLFLVGIGMGAALAGARFGFTTGWRTLDQATARPTAVTAAGTISTQRALFLSAVWSRSSVKICS